ncbi:motility associated factor glycosyltransferase family protein [Sporosarcina beigongshangi]|uniref:motility associated factor glycosyltransferase family protein n=1 Tax=Sporosarcina beigongshangi TaxID=2782538 RepID=UPI002ACE4B52|nr:6-hydroxymethylpterin diphosphokinase MptE-like protein [Sporosarcina beigongshangi]
MQTYIIEKIPAKNGLFTLKVNNLFLHSKYDPLKESEQFAQKHYTENYLHIMFGFGLGYYASALQRKFGENDRLIIIDPLFEKHENSTELEGIPIFYDIDPQKIESEIKKLLVEYAVNVKVICLPNHEKLFPTEYKRVLNIVQDVLRINAIYRNTINFFAESWQENYVRNLIHVLKDESLTTLEKRFDFPVVVASGGPSLIKQIPKLKEVRNKIILIASGSTINTLLHYNIEPDFIVSIDGSENNYNHFKDNVFTNSYFIYSIRNHYKIRNQFKKRAFSFIPSIESDVREHVEKITHQKLPMLFGGSSVANYALTISLYISTGKIALVGQDLAYTDNKTHAEHNKYFKKVDDNFKKERSAFYIEGYNGDQVLTDAPLLSMKKNFEQILELSNEKDRLFNCTEGGAKIEGFQQISFNDFCCDLSDINIDLNFDEINNINIGNFVDEIEKEIITYEKLVVSLDKASKLLKRNKSNSTFNNKVIRGLDKIDKEIKKIFDTVSMNSIVEPITIDTLNYFLPKQNESKKEEFDRVFSQNDQLYNRLLSAAKLSKQYTEELLEDVTKITEGENNDGSTRTN